ncbi:hypothetical protein VOLCADRAFT_116300 [Volvox carteri f. nagariensis]|uniref:Coenzyme Q-binding protein COQ10 START domain-containing protein n=1 Tax=Volvox carteri f. nagariensis TaxID=3068 RepID=D8TL00_VOLCA|nr:uncharacterized protein VOLCADRAFT_116300 [Volvox carteri f. nagariensis]EFJ51787.1 hypothetical protein VOLCADRAFT_116300 [Volvox carteri f. nagariensis]|eukprot:XP_002947197.1 hypothetical protein VOLCADRAFT_116300 [Volvox carteri f. nagariensis]
MMFGWGRGNDSPEQLAATSEAGGDARLTPGLAAMSAGSGAVGWAPLPVGNDTPRNKQQGQPQPFKLKAHDVKTYLQDRSTAVVDLCSHVDAPADVIFDLLADPHQHERIFDAIESASAELVSEEGPVRKWRLDYRARWRFWKVGGVCDNRLWMTTDRELGTVSFVLREPGFLRKYEGTWTITGPDGRGPGAGSRGAPGGPTRSRGPAAAAAAAAAVAADGGVANATSDQADAVGDLSRLRLRREAAGLAPPSPSACSDTSSEPRSHALRLSSRCSSAGSLTSSSSSGSLERCSAGSASAGRSSSSSSGNNGGGVGDFAGMFAAINNPFTTTTATTALPPLLLTIFRSVPGSAAATSAASAGAGVGIGVGATGFGASHAAQCAVQPPLTQQRLQAPPLYPTTIRVRKAISPKVSPPYPINQVLKGHAAGQVNDMLQGLLVATARKIEEEEQVLLGLGPGPGFKGW